MDSISAHYRCVLTIAFGQTPENRETTCKLQENGQRGPTGDHGRPRGPTASHRAEKLTGERGHTRGERDWYPKASACWGKNNKTVVSPPFRSFRQVITSDFELSLLRTGASENLEAYFSKNGLAIGAQLPLPRVRPPRVGRCLRAQIS